MVLAKIHVENEEEKTSFVLDIYCTHVEQVDEVKKILQDFKNDRNNRFWHSQKYIEELEKHNYSAQEVEYPIEIY